jgi:adenine-specific DNA-methyltransferase
MPVRAELIWDGKNDPSGQRTRPLRVKLPFQTVETVNESMADRGSLFRAAKTPWRNRLIWGDKKYVLPALLDEFAGKVNLIYIDPPFDTGADFSFTASVPTAPENDDDESGVSFEKQPSVLEQKAYRDTWGRGLDSYLQWFYETAIFMHELLHEYGSLYVHLDWHVGHYAKVILDEVFGPSLFQNEIIWQRTSAHSDTHRYGMNYDAILLYTKGDSFCWNGGYHAYTEQQKAKYRPDAKGRLFADFDLTASGTRKGSSGKPWKGHDPNTRGNHWKYGIETLEQLNREDRIYWPNSGGFPRMKRYLDEMKGVPLQSVWTDIPPVNSQAAERLAYRTQKPEALLERIIKASSNEDDLVLDCFCGSGTTPAVAEKLNRRWIACDLGRFAIHTTRKRLLGIASLRPFVVQNLGKYERQQWQVHEFAGGDKTQAAAVQHAYVDFILKLYHATPVSGRTWLHGAKAGRQVHVGSVDSPVTMDDVRLIVKEFKQTIGTGKDAPKTNGVDVLGWDFSFELNEVAAKHAADANVQVRFLRIPREAMDRKAVEQGDVKFFELNALALKKKTKGKTATVELVDFVIPPDDVPEDVRGKIDHFSQWIDFWAVDWDHGGDSFHNMWQSFRTRDEPKLRLTAEHVYEEGGDYTVMVKVIDILGNDTTQVVKLKLN